jgi:transitional endoplasmic reticulum ATPase
MIELPMKHPEVFQTLGISPPSGVLLHGPPGTGKTLIAKAVANESGASFYSIAGPEIMSKYYGESEQRLREIFDEARDRTPSIVFIDELDSIAPRRGDVTGEVERRVVAQLLTIMDGLEERGEIIIVGATNRVDAIDPALRRPGRFDREIEISVPDYDGRKEILQIHTRDMPLANDVNLEELARITHGFVGADLLSVTKEAAMRALRRYMPDIDLDKDIPEEILTTMKITSDDFSEAFREIQPSALREILVEIPNTTWNDVGGLEEARQELIEAIEWPLQDPQSFRRMGIKPPRGILLFGPPGTGKTLIVRAVANETEANFISVRGPELISKWVGESERAVRNVFKKARQVAPVVIFLDELDALAPMRGIEDTSRVSERVVNTLLTELDGLQDLKDIVVIAATNRPDIIDPALLRSGRFDRIILLGAPQKSARVSILNIHTRTMPLSDDVDIEELADLTEWYVGSDLETLCKEAGMLALREAKDIRSIEMRHFREALKKVRPAIDERTMQYYEQIKQRFAGGRPAEPTTHMSYQ